MRQALSCLSTSPLPGRQVAPIATKLSRLILPISVQRHFRWPHPQPPWKLSFRALPTISSSAPVFLLVQCLPPSLRLPTPEVHSPHLRPHCLAHSQYPTDAGCVVERMNAVYATICWGSVSSSVIGQWDFPVFDRINKTIKEDTILWHFYSPREKDSSMHICIISTWYKVTSHQMCVALNCYYDLSAERENQSGCPFPSPQLLLLPIRLRKILWPDHRCGNLTVSIFGLNQ